MMKDPKQPKLTKKSFKIGDFIVHTYQGIERFGTVTHFDLHDGKWAADFRNPQSFGSWFFTEADLKDVVLLSREDHPEYYL